MGIKTSRAGSISKLRRSTARPTGDDAFLNRIAADSSITIRFLTEPEEWQEYFEHYDQVMKFYPCTDTECPGCAEGDRPSKKYLANVWLADDGKVVPQVIAKSLVAKLLNRYDKYGTIMDRPYELIRMGSGMDTDYDVNPESPERFTKKVTLLDLEKVLDGQLSRGRAEAGLEPTPADDEEDEAQRTTRNAVKPTKRAVKPLPVEEDEDEEDEEDEKGEHDRDELEEMSLRDLRAYAKGEASLTAAAIKGLDSEELIDLIMGEESDEDDEPEEDDTDDDDTDDDDTDDDDEDDEDDEDEDADDEDEDEDEGLTPEQVKALSKTELKGVLDQIEVKYKPTESITALRAKVLAYMAEDEDDDEPPF